MTSWIIRNWAEVIHPANEGYRTVPVTIHDLVIGSAPEHIERQVRLLCENQQNISLDSFVKSFLEIHPFIDGNGRTASLIYNYLNGTLYNPHLLPDYFGEDANAVTPEKAVPQESLQ